MVWLVRYTKYNYLNGVVLSNQIGNILGGNCQEVIQKVCRLKKIKPPQKHKHGDQTQQDCSYISEAEYEPESYEYIVHSIVVAAEDELIDV